MASTAQANDDSKMTNTTAAESVKETATTATLTTNTTSDNTISANGATKAIDKNPQTGQAPTSESPVKNGSGEDSTTTGELLNSTSTPVDSGSATKSNESPSIATPTSTGSVTNTSSNLSFQTPTSAPRSKPLEKPKPLKLEHQQHPHHTSPSQLLYHPAAGAGPGAFATLGGPPVLGALPHPIYVGAAHLAQQQVGGPLHHIQSTIHPHGQQQPNANHAAGDGAAAVSTGKSLADFSKMVCGCSRLLGLSIIVLLIALIIGCYTVCNSRTVKRLLAR